MELPSSASPDVDDGGVEEITINPVVIIPTSTLNENKEGQILNMKLETHQNANHNYNSHKHSSDIEATADSGRAQIFLARVQGSVIS